MPVGPHSPSRPPTFPMDPPHHPPMGQPPPMPGGRPMPNGLQVSAAMAEHARKMQDYETLCQIISQWNANRLDLFALTLPNEHLEFNGVMRFYYQSQDKDDSGQKVATKCIRVTSTATTKAIIETLIEKFRPDMKMLEVPEYALYEIHESGERRLNPEEKPLLVQLNWHKDDREGRFLLRRIDEASRMPEPNKEDSSFKRKLSRREKKQLKKQEKMNKLKDKENRDSASSGGQDGGGVAEKLYTELPDTSFTRSISNPEAVMRRRRQQKLERKLQQFRSKDGGPDTGGTLKIYGEAICKYVPYKTLLLSIRDPAGFVVEEMLEKYGRDRREAPRFCLVQCSSTIDREGEEVKAQDYYLEDDECPLEILMHHPPAQGTVTFHVRPKPNDMYPRKRKKKPMFPGAVVSDSVLPRDSSQFGFGPSFLIETSPDGSEMPHGMALKFAVPTNVTEVGSDPAIQGTQSIHLPSDPFIFPRHCVLAHTEGIVTVTPSHRDAETYVGSQRIMETTILQHGNLIRFGRSKCFRFLDGGVINREQRRLQTSSATLPDMRQSSNYVHFGPPSSSLGGDGGLPTIRGKDNILPAVLEFREESEEGFFNAITVGLDIHTVQFKLASTYTIYMATRFRASTHYRPELIPEERAVRLTDMLNRVAEKIYNNVQLHQHEAPNLAFWMANASELLHFLKCDRHITSFSLQAQDILAETVHLSFKQLVLCLQNQLRNVMPQMLHDSDEDEKSIPDIMMVLSSAMNLLRKCRVNAALTIQLFSQLFHFINMWTFNHIVMSGYPRGGERPTNYCNHRWGLRLKKRLSKIETWAERQGLELAADCHLARVVQAAHLLLARKNSAEDIASVSSICFKLNSLQLKTLLHKYEPEPNETPISNEMIDTIVRVAENTVDEMTNSEGREVRLEEDFVLQLPFLLPEDGYSCDIVRGVPGGLVEFIAPLQQTGLCVMTPQPTSSGFWTIYMDRLDATPMMGSPVPSEMSQNTTSGEGYPSNFGPQHHPNPHGYQPHPSKLASPSKSGQSAHEPEVQTIQLAKPSNGMGLSIVAAKGVGKDRLGIYIKAVVDGGAAHHDGRLEAGDQLLTVDGHSLVGITQERAAEIMMRTGPVVTLIVAKQGAIFHGLATLLSQPSPLMTRSGGQGGPSQRPTTGYPRPIGPYNGQDGSNLTQSKSVPSLYAAADSQHTYQNQGPAFRQSDSASRKAPPMPPPAPGASYGRSSSFQHLGPPPPQQLTDPRAFSNAQDDQGFYQNVGPNGQPMFSAPSHRPSSMGVLPPGAARFHSQSSLHRAGGPATPGVDVYHASPRVVGTPEDAPHSANQPKGPEKPQRQYAYQDDFQHRPGSQMSKEAPSSHQNGHPGRKESQTNRVRFQEPEERHDASSSSSSKESLSRDDPKPENMSEYLEQLRISSVEKEFKRRIAEYSCNESPDSGNEDPHLMSQIRGNRDRALKDNLDQKRQELSQTRYHEERILLEAEKRRQQSSRGSGETPPPLPSVPPPDEASAAAPGTERLDMLVGSVLKGPPTRADTPNGNEQQANQTPTKRVSFSNEPNMDPRMLSELNGIDESRELIESDGLPRQHEDPQSFIREAETLLNQSSISLERFDMSKSTGHTPSVIGAQEVYRDPRAKLLENKAQEQKATEKTRDGAKLSFHEKMKLFAVEAGESEPRDRAKISRAQRDIDFERAEDDESNA